MENTLSFKLVKKPLDMAAMVFFVFEKDDIVKHSLYKFLDIDEKVYLAKVRLEINPKEKESRLVVTPAGRKIILAGLGKKENFSSQKAGLLTRIAVQAARHEKIKQFAFFAGPVGGNKKTRDFYETVAAGAVMANFEFGKYKTSLKKDFVEEIHAVASRPSRAISEGLKRGAIAGEEVNNCRVLSNTPGGDMTPAILAKHALEDAKGLPIRVNILEEKDIKKLGMGGVLGVSKGSGERPRFIVMEYLGGGKSKKPIVLVGKGVTFDTGGLNLKPTEGIYEMHMDMSGGSAVIHAVRAAARLKIKKNIIALVPAVENMPSGSSYRPGDILRAMSGKTIEVLNTDAEGRIILADALEYAKKYNPALVVDVATLTGASITALGKKYIGLFTERPKLEKILRKIGEESGERVWPLPMTAEFEEEIKGTFGDWANTGKGRHGDASSAAVFLWQFTKDASGRSAYPWVHLDIAPRMTSSEGEFLTKGALGSPVRLLLRLLEEF